MSWLFHVFLYISIFGGSECFLNIRIKANRQKLYVTDRKISYPVIENVTFVSGNEMKKSEVQLILQGNIPYNLIFDTVEFDEPQASPIEISQTKCRQAVAHVKGPCIVEDTSLCFNALNGLPGPYIKWFVESLGNVGLSRLLDGFEDKTGFAQCVVSFSPGIGHDVYTFVGIAEGKIIKPVGAFGFGWDSVFVPYGHNITFAQMTKAEKNKFSHRSKAMEKFKQFINNYPYSLDMSNKDDNDISE